MGFWLMPKPPVFKPFEIKFENESDIAEIVEFIRPLRIAQVIPNSVVIAGVLWEASTCNTRRSDYTTEPGATPDAILKQIQKDKNLGAWNVYAALYGTRSRSTSTGRSSPTLKNWARAASSPRRGRRHPALQVPCPADVGVPNLQEFGLYNWRGGGGSMWFAPVSQARGSECDKQQALAKKILNKHGLDYVGEFIVGWRDMHHVIDVLYDRTNPEETKRANACFAELLDEFEKEGYAVYRVNTAFQERVAQSYGPVKRKVEHAIKRALDPNNILAPGKSGIDLANSF
jgi:4-cresol dehydrogenase (hydroxylating)